MKKYDQSKYKVGMQVGGFVVRASKLLDITGYHKFKAKVFRLPSSDNLLVRFEYCKGCSKARSYINVQGEHLDYVQKTLSEQPVPTLERYLINPNLFINNFKGLIIKNYKEMKGDS